MTEDPYEQWLTECRKVSPPVTLPEQIMDQIAELELPRQETWWLGLAQRIEHSPTVRWAVCCGALAIGSLPFVVLAHVSKLLTF